MECTICLEPISVAATTGHVRCGHWFHFDCLHLWSQRSSSCPICRQQFDEVVERAIRESESTATVSSIPVFGPVIKRLPCVRRPVPLSPVPPEEAMRLYEFVFQQDDAEMEDVECESCGQSPCVCDTESFAQPGVSSRRRGPGRSRASGLLGRLGRRQTSQTSQPNLVFDTRRRRTTSAAGARGLTLSSDNYFLNDADEVDPLTTLPSPSTRELDDETLGRMQDNIEETRNLARASRASVEERAWRFLDEYRQIERQPSNSGSGRRRSSLFNVFNADNEGDSRPPTSNDTPRTSVPSAHNSVATSISSASGSSVFSAMSARSSASSSRMSLASQPCSSRQSSMPWSAPVTFRRPTPLPFRNPLAGSSPNNQAESEVPSPRSGSPRNSPPAQEQTRPQSGSVSPATDAISHIHVNSPSEVSQSQAPASAQTSSESVSSSGHALSYEKKVEIRKLVKTRLHRYYPDFINKEQFTEINMSVCDRVYSYIKGAESREPFTATQAEKWTKVVHHLVSADLVAQDLL
ncbi:hypothetical protein CJU89_0020 [Yarrowia sp. B02]|nr:hypothetical protein CJU89_0020 [Yarrowia sp. B02]